MKRTHEEEAAEEQPAAKKAEIEPAQAQPPITVPPGLPPTCVTHNRYLDRLHRHPRDYRVFFDPGTPDDRRHDYYVDWAGNGQFADRTYAKSVTYLVHAFFREFDADKVILTMMNGKNWFKSKYFGQTPDQIKELWGANGLESRTEGTAMHDFIDRYYNGEVTLNDIKEEQKELLHFRDFVQFETGGKSPYRAEWLVFTDDELRISGSIDMIFVDDAVMESLWKNVQYGASPPKTLHLVMYDWKRSKKISTYNKWEPPGYEPCENMRNTNFFHYSLQLNLYKWILENFYKNVTWRGVVYENVSVDFMHLCVLHPRKRKYELHRCPDYQPEVAQIMELRRASLKRMREGKPALFPFDLTQPPPEPKRSRFVNDVDFCDD